MTLGLPAVILAEASTPESTEISNAAIFGVEDLEQPTHDQTFAAVEFIPDPLQPFNRFALRVTKPVIDWVLVPVAKGYRFVVPTAVRQALDRFSYNLTFPGRFISLVLQGELRKTPVETAHFLMNTTVGVGGLFDVAAPMGIETYPEDVGQAFARWGIGPGFYLFLPLLGPSTARDAVGRVFDTALSPLLWVPVPGLGVFFNVNAFTFRIDGYETLEAAFPDPYLPLRALWSIQRQIEIENYTIPEEAYTTSDPEPSLDALLLKLQDPGFPRRAQTRNVRIPPTGRSLPYSLWLQEGRAPVLFIIPGIGAHRLSTLPACIAEMAYRRGYSVVVVSSPFHPEFIRNALTVVYPGYTPSDTEDLYLVLSEVWQDLQENYGSRRFAQAKLLGYSLGALETLFIAAAQDNRPRDGMRFERFVGINPPVDLLDAARRFDAYFDAPLAWPQEDRGTHLRHLLMKALLLMQDELPEDRPLPFDRTESEFIVGIGGRATISEALRAIRERGGAKLVRDAQSNGTAPTLLGSLLQWSFLGYYEEFALPYFAARSGREFNREAMLEAAGLPSRGVRLRGREDVRIVHNADDFLLGESGLEWLRDNFRERLTVFPSGGHLGNLHLEAVQDAIFNQLGDSSTEQTRGQRWQLDSGAWSLEHADRGRWRNSGLHANIAGVRCPRTDSAEPARCGP